MASSSTDPSLAALSSHPLPGTEDHDDTVKLAPPVPGSDRYRKTSLAPSVGGHSFVSDSTEQYFTDANEDAQSAITITRSDTSASFQDADNTFSSSPEINNFMSHSQSTQRAASPTLTSQLISAAGPATAAAAGSASVPVEVVPPTSTLPAGVNTSVEPGTNPTKQTHYDDDKSAPLKTVPSSSQTDETKTGASGEKGGPGDDPRGGVEALDDPELSHLTDEQRRIVVEQM